MAKPKLRTSTKKAVRERKATARTRLPANLSLSAQRGPGTKHARIIAMLRTPTGTTIAAIMSATNWQQHSVRGFLAGVVRKKLGFKLVSEKMAKGRVYQIKEGPGSAVPPPDQAV